MKDLFAGARDEAIIDTRLRTDVYKYIMQYFARKMGKHNTQVVFGLTNRNPEMRLADVIPEAYLREQLDVVKSMMMTPAQASFIQGMTVNDEGKQTFMYPDASYTNFMLGQTMSDYNLEMRDGQFDLTFSGTWFGDQNSASHWEIPAMAIISESYVYWYLKRKLEANEITQSEIAAVFAEAYQRVVASAQTFRDADGLPTFAHFGLRRATSQAWMYTGLDIIADICPDNCIGASDVQLMFDDGKSNPIGTRAHEAAMVWATLGPDTDDWLRESQFDLDINWGREMPRPLRILLPDCFGSEQYYQHAPAEIARMHAGVRIDSMETADHDPLYLQWLLEQSVDPKTQIVIPSDGQNAKKFVPEYQQFDAQYRALSAGTGGMWTNDIKGLLADPLFRTPNIVIKSQYANGRPCTKIGDAPNGGKVTGVDSENNARYIRAFSAAGWKEHSGQLAA